MTDSSVEESKRTVYACSFCGKTMISRQTCSRCRLNQYCNATCQKQDWPKHKPQCKPVAERKHEGVVMPKKNLAVTRRLAKTLLNIDAEVGVKLMQWSSGQRDSAKQLHVQYVGAKTRPSRKELAHALTRAIRYREWEMAAIRIHVASEGEPRPDPDVLISLRDRPATGATSRNDLIVSSCIQRRGLGVQVGVDWSASSERP